MNRGDQLKHLTEAATTAHDPDTQAQQLVTGLENLAALLKSDSFRNAAYKLEDEPERKAAADNLPAYLKQSGVALPQSLYIPPRTSQPAVILISVCFDWGDARVCIFYDSDDGWHLKIDPLVSS